MAHEFIHTHGLEDAYRVDGDGKLHPILSADEYDVCRFSGTLHIVRIADLATRAAPALLVDEFGAAFGDAVQANDTPQSLADMVRDTAGKVYSKMDARLGIASLTMLNKQCPKQAVGVIALACVAAAVDVAASKGGASWLNLTPGEARNVACVLVERVATSFGPLFEATRGAQFGADPADVLRGVDPDMLRPIMHSCMQRELPEVFVSDDDLDEAMFAAVVLTGELSETLGHAGCETLKWLFDAAAVSFCVVLGTSTERIEGRMRPQTRELLLVLASFAPLQPWAVTIMAMFRGLGRADLSSVVQDNAVWLQGDPNDGEYSPYDAMGSREQTVHDSLRETLVAKTPEEGELGGGGLGSELQADNVAFARFCQLLLPDLFGAAVSGACDAALAVTLEDKAMRAPGYLKSAALEALEQHIGGGTGSAGLRDAEVDALAAGVASLLGGEIQAANVAYARACQLLRPVIFGAAVRGASDAALAVLKDEGKRKRKREAGYLKIAARAELAPHVDDGAGSAGLRDAEANALAAGVASLLGSELGGELQAANVAFARACELLRPVIFGAAVRGASAAAVLELERKGEPKAKRGYIKSAARAALATHLAGGPGSAGLKDAEADALAAGVAALQSLRRCRAARSAKAATATAAAIPVTECFKEQYSQDAYDKVYKAAVAKGTTSTHLSKTVAVVKSAVLGDIDIAPEAIEAIAKAFITIRRAEKSANQAALRDGTRKRKITAWTEAEEKALRSLVATLGTQWTEIAKDERLAERDHSSCKYKWYSLLRKDKKAKLSAGSK